MAIEAYTALEIGGVALAVCGLSFQLFDYMDARWPIVLRLASGRYEMDWQAIEQTLSDERTKLFCSVIRRIKWACMGGRRVAKFRTTLQARGRVAFQR